MSDKKTTKKVGVLPIRQTEFRIADAAEAVATFVTDLSERGLTITAFGIPIQIVLGPKP